MFNASTRITGLSLNAAFQLLTGWTLRLAGTPLVHFVCQAGMKPCVLGTNRSDYTMAPPCDACLAQSGRLHAGAEVHGFAFKAAPHLVNALENLNVEELSQIEYPLPAIGKPNSKIPLGRLVLPSIRWALRRHTLPDDEPTRYLLRQYILSAYNVANEFAGLLERVQPQATLIFNGAMYPEATARWVSRQMGVRSLAHEVGFQHFSTFFTEGEPTAYPIHIPEDFELSEAQNARLEAYLEQRFQGKFTMAGIRFWPEMRGLDEVLIQKIASFRQVVPVFTNVVYDTSQVHANVIFPHMFAWLELVAEVIRHHPETLFVIRAHPDEMRPGSAKQSRESVHDWVKNNRVDELPNVVFIDSQEYISSYELIQRAKFVMVYNSSIGLEATLMEKAVLCAGKARYTQLQTVFFPHSLAEYNQMMETMLAADAVHLPPEFTTNARRFLYYQLYRASLPLDGFLQSGRRMGFVELQEFSWEALLPQNSPALRVITDGILHGTPFLMPEN
jgi:Capsule polysaccharide biosynthesis protein